MKFLGLVYDGEKDLFYADTREGASLIFDKQDLLVAFNKRESPYKEKDSQFSWHTFITSKLAGFVQSRMYNDGWNMEDYFQSFKLKFSKGS